MHHLNRHPKIFGLGLHKTGTSSLTDALNLLGIKTIHKLRPFHVKTYDELASGNYKLSVLEEYQSIVDVPIVPYYAQLDSTYPGSKFILTVRDKEHWLTSAETFWRITEEQIKREPSIEPSFIAFTEFAHASVYGSIGFNRDRFSYVYDVHTRNVCEYFANRPNDLLVMDICAGDGWEKLCPFLGVSVLNVPFPHANRFMHDFLAVRNDLETIIPNGYSFILVDGDQLGPEVTNGLRAIPFLERDGVYWGPPPDDDTAIREFERLRQAGARFMVFAWPAFWWLDFYAGLHQHLRSTFRRVFENDSLIVFDLMG